MTKPKAKPKARPVGRPSDYRPKYCHAIIRHMATGASATSFAASIDVARSTINVWAQEHTEFSEALHVGKAKCAAWWEQRGRAGASGEQVSAPLVAFGLSNMAADDWKQKQTTELTGKDGGPVEVRAAEMSPEDRRAEIKRLLALHPDLIGD